MDDHEVTHVFGWDADLGLDATAESTAVYVAGRSVVLRSLDRNRVKVLPQQDRVRRVLAIALSPSRRFLAVCERVVGGAAGCAESARTGSRPPAQCTIWDLRSQGVASGESGVRGCMP